MLVKINKSNDLSNYVIKTTINKHILNINKISNYMALGDKIEIESSLSLDESIEKNGFFKKLLIYIFGLIYIYFNSLDELLDAREYKNTICVESFNDNSVLEINYFWDELKKKVDVKVKVSDGKIIINEISTIKNQIIYNQKIRRYKRIFISSWVLLLTIPLFFLIIAFIYNNERMIIAQSIILILFIILFFITYCKKKK